MLYDNEKCFVVCWRCLRRGNEKALSDTKDLVCGKDFVLNFSIECETCEEFWKAAIKPTRILPVDNNKYVIVYERLYQTYECRTKDTDWQDIDPVCPACNKKHERKRVGLTSVFVVQEPCKTFKEKWPKGHAIPKENFK